MKLLEFEIEVSTGFSTVISAKSITACEDHVIATVLADAPNLTHVNITSPSGAVFQILKQAAATHWRHNGYQFTAL